MKMSVHGATVTLRVTADVVLCGLQVMSVFSSHRVGDPLAAWRLFVVLHKNRPGIR